jgi:hypothetical protein
VELVRSQSQSQEKQKATPAQRQFHPGPSSVEA